jgi:hypothetical protein
MIEATTVRRFVKTQKLYVRHVRDLTAIYRPISRHGLRLRICAAISGARPLAGCLQFFGDHAALASHEVL